MSDWVELALDLGTIDRSGAVSIWFSCLAFLVGLSSFKHIISVSISQSSIMPPLLVLVVKVFL